MKFRAYILFVALFFISSCRDEDFIYDYPVSDKLLVSITRGSGNVEYVTYFKYDSLNRISAIVAYKDGTQLQDESFVYDKQGRLIEKNNASFTYSYTYNSKGRLIERNTHFTPDDGKWEWDVLTKYAYRNGQLVTGINYPRKYVGIENSQESQALSSINYKYDANGNTVEQGGDGSSYTFKYDSKINPLAEFGIQTIYSYSFLYTLSPEIKQVNNPVSIHSLISVMSSMSPSYEIMYQYDSNDLPITAEIKRLYVSSEESNHLEFHYRSKN